jgi:hypothetical protein
MNLFGNAFTGSIPSEVGLLTKLSTLLVYCNFWVYIQTVTDLTLCHPLKAFLNFQANFLTGIIPSELESLTELCKFKHQQANEASYIKYIWLTHFCTFCWIVFLGLNGNLFSSPYECPQFIDVCCVLCCDLQGPFTEDDENFDSPCREIWEKSKSMLNAYFTWNTCIGVMEYVNTLLYSRIVLHLAVPLQWLLYLKCNIKSNELWRGRVMATRHTSAEWYLFGGCNVLVVTTFRTGLLLFPLLFIVIIRTWWVRQHLLCLSDPMAMARAQELQEWVWEMENGHGGATHIL